MASLTNQVIADKIVYGGVDKVVVTLLKKTEGVWGLDPTKAYVLTDCVEGTTSSTKTAGDVTEIKDENGEVLYALIGKSTRNFATETGDLQPTILEGLFGFTKGTGDDAGLWIEPVGVPEIYAQVDIYFLGGGALARMYKVRLDPSVTLEGLNTGIGRGILSGTIMNIGSGTSKKAFAIGTLTTPDVITDFTSTP